jgi:3-dehydroquinate synthase
MQTITLKTPTTGTSIYVGAKYTEFETQIGNSNPVIITDSNVKSLYGSKFSEFNIIEIKPGEKSKSLKTLEIIYKQLLDINFDRYGLIIGIGGGVVCDITGFVASTYLRGLRFGFVATTLLAQVDAAIGGKNGVNFQSYKNIIGTITQPEFVFCDPKMLDTLPDEQFRCGLAEIVKTALIRNKKMFDILDEDKELLAAKEHSILKKIILESIKIKASIVEEDEKDKGQRQILNLGHTFAHAIESKTGIHHGDAVSIGICKAAEISTKLGLLSNSEFERIKLLLKSFKLPVESKIDFAELLPAIIHDKKKKDENINYVLLKNIGNPVIQKFRYDELKKLF